MGLSYSDDKDDAGFGAMISAEGELSDYIKLPMILTSRKTWNEKVILTLFSLLLLPHKSDASDKQEPAHTGQDFYPTSIFQLVFWSI